MGTRAGSVAGQTEKRELAVRLGVLLAVLGDKDQGGPCSSVPGARPSPSSQTQHFLPALTCRIHKAIPSPVLKYANYWRKNTQKAHSLDIFISIALIVRELI